MFEVLSQSFRGKPIFQRINLAAWPLFLLLAWPLTSHASPAPLSNYFQESWTTRDGLPHNTINSISQSADGYLWLATWEGAARFNGRQFDIFGRGELTGLPDSGIRTLSKDQAGNLLLAGSRGGISKRTTEGWQSWPAFNVLINAVAEEANGTMWLASEGQGLFRQTADGQRQQFTVADGLASDVVHSLLLDDTGRLWIGSGRGLHWLDTRDSAVSFISVAGLPLAPVFVLRQYGDRILIGTERGLFQHNGGETALLHAALQNMPVSALLVQDQQIWIGTTDRGLLRYSRQGLETLSMAGGLPNNRILALYLDREKSVWVGTNGGLFRLRDAPFVTYTAEQGLAGDYVRAVLAHSDGSVWLGTSQGISRYTATGIEPIDLSAASAGQSILSLVEAENGVVWIGTYTDGVLRYQDGNVTAQYSRATGLLSNEIRAIQPDGSGGIWLGTGQGLNHVATDGRVQSFSKAQGLPTPFVLALYQHRDGRLFIGTGGGVAVRQPDGTITTLDFSALDGAEYAFGFAADPVIDVLWMTTDRGLVAYSLQSGQLQILGRRAGLPFDKVFQTVIDREQNLWLSGNRGILRLVRTQVEQQLAGRRTVLDYELFGESDGMQSAQANGGSMQAAAMAHDGRIWFATSKGASTVQPAQLKRFAANIPPVVLEGVNVNGNSVALQSGLELPAGVNRLELQFAGLGYIMPQRIQYSTRLTGFDTDWVMRGSNASSEYTNLAPGQYQFAVRAAYPQGAWSEQAATFNFIIQPYYWQRPLFWGAIVAVSIILLGVTLRWRLRVLKQREQLLRLQVAEKTLELQHQADHLRAVDKERSELLQQIKHQAEEFELQARLDSLTGLANRRAFDEALMRECARSRRNRQPLCLVLLDIDHFKQVNDSYSHSIGDEILVQVANAINSLSRQDDIVARWGGEEFALLLPNTAVAEAADICERIRLAIMQIDCSHVAEDLRITVSLGVAGYEYDVNYNKLLSRSDAALYQAKQQGRNRVIVAN
jgi:diguanylate cyclase (GGDEF)-like protein